MLDHSQRPAGERPSQKDILGLFSTLNEHPRPLNQWAQRGIFGFNSRDGRSRTFNLLRNQVVKKLSENGGRIISLTSATPRVGKSFIAANLAASLSRLKSFKTILFDLDLRRGTIAETFGIPAQQGIQSFLNGEIDTLAGTAWSLPDTNLTVYPCFPEDMGSAELLSGERMEELVDAMRALPPEYLCVLDLPPAFANDDASIVTKLIDGYLLIVEEGVTTARQVSEVMHIMEPSVCLGTVLNRYKGNLGSDSYGFGYGSSKGYNAYYSDNP